MATGDFNHDGIADLAVADSDVGDGGQEAAGTVSILLGTGNGYFEPQAAFPAGVTPSSVAVGDLNGDGNSDFIETNYNGFTVSRFLGDGVGGFAPRQSVSPGRYPEQAILADLNGDGILDIAAADFGQAEVAIFQGVGDGGFGSGRFGSTPTTTLMTGDAPSSLAAGDFNEDGLPDIAVANSNVDAGFYAAGTVSVFINSGNGTFEPQAVFPAGDTPSSIAVGDFNDDGHLDLAEVNSNGGTVSPLFGYGDGGFAPRLLLDTSLYPGAMVVSADFNGDGTSDLAVSGSGIGGQSNEDVDVFLSYRDGGFAAPIQYSVGSSAKGLAVGDFNGDGRPDLAVTSEGDNTVSVLLTRCTP